MNLDSLQDSHRKILGSYLGLNWAKPSNLEVQNLIDSTGLNRPDLWYRLLEYPLSLGFTDCFSSKIAESRPHFPALLDALKAWEGALSQSEIAILLCGESRPELGLFFHFIRSGCRRIWFEEDPSVLALLCASDSEFLQKMFGTRSSLWVIDKAPASQTPEESIHRILERVRKGPNVVFDFRLSIPQS